MAKTITAALDTHIQQSVTTLATIWKITRRDGNVFRFTDHDQDLTYDDGGGDEVYKAQDGYEASQIQSRDNLQVDNLEATGLLNSETGAAFLSDSAITAQDLKDGKYDGATVTVRVVNWQDTTATSGSLIMKTGTIGEVSIRNRDTYQAEVRGLTQNLTQQTGFVYGQQCRANLFDDKCSNVVDGSGPVKANFTDESRVETVTNDRVFILPLDSDTGFTFNSSNGEGEGVEWLQTGFVTPLEDTTPDGSVERPFEISTPAELEAIPDSTSNSYVLTANIDMTGRPKWTPINGYNGTFDGRGYTISNLDLDQSGAPQQTGLFDTTGSSAIIRRVGIINSAVRANSSFWKAPLVVYLFDNALMEDCWSEGCTITTDGDRAAGLIGYTGLNCTIRRCWASNSWVGGGSQIGGVIGSGNAGNTTEPNFFDSDVAGHTSVGALNSSIAYTTPEMQNRRRWSEATGSGFDFLSTWKQPIIGYSDAPTLTWNAGGKTITRSAGSWITDGFAIGDYLWVDGEASQTQDVFTISNVTATVITVDAGDTVVDEGPAAVTFAMSNDAYPLILDPGRF